MGFLRVAEKYFPQVCPPVVDLGAVAFHNRTDDRDHRVEHVSGPLCCRSAVLDRLGVAGVLHGKSGRSLLVFA